MSLDALAFLVALLFAANFVVRLCVWFVAGVRRRRAARRLAPDPRLVRAYELAHEGKPGEAVILWDEVIRTGDAPARATALASRAAIRRTAGDRDGASADLDEAIRLAPDYADAYVMRASVRLEGGEFDGAAEDAETALRLESERPAGRVLACRASARLGRGETDAALADSEEAAKRSPGDAFVWAVRGAARHRSGDLDGALDDFGESLRLSPDYVAALSGRAVVRVTRGDAAGAAEDAGRAVRLGDDSPANHVTLGLCRRAGGDPAGAVREYEAALRLDPECDVAHNNLAWLLATHPDATVRDGTRAVAHGEAACRITGRRHFDWLDTLAASYAEASEFAKAVETQRTAIALAPESEKDDLRSHLALYEAGRPFREREIGGRVVLLEPSGGAGVSRSDGGRARRHDDR